MVADSNGATALALAAFCGHDKCVKLLLGHSPAPKEESKEGGGEEVNTNILNKTDLTGATPLWLACSKV